uniref:glutaminase n=1 Tax=Ditylenchus dipsaci TaxID=166011 RepID=A0A915EGH6_9BILA
MYLERNQDAKCVKENLIRLFRVACGGCWFKKGEADVYKPLTERFYCSAVCPFEIRLVKSNDGTAQEVTLEDGLHNSKCQNAEQTRVALRVWNLKKLPMEIIFDIFLFINYSCYLRILPILPSPLSQALRRTRQFLHFINRNMARVPEVLEKMDETKSKFLRKFRFSNDHEYQTFGVIYDILGSRLFVSCFDLINMPSTIGALVKEACEEKDLDEQAVQFYDLNAVALLKARFSKHFNHSKMSHVVLPCEGIHEAALFLGNAVRTKYKYDSGKIYSATADPSQTSSNTQHETFNDARLLKMWDTIKLDKGFSLAELDMFPCPHVNIQETLDLYFQLCSIKTNTEWLAVMAATLANGGVNPLTEQRVVCNRAVRDTLSLMLSCGMYDYSGQFAFNSIKLAGLVNQSKQFNWFRWSIHSFESIQLAPLVNSFI